MSAIQLYHRKGDELRYNATLRDIFGDDHFFKAPIRLEMEYKLSSESVNITCIGDKEVTVLDNKGQKLVIASGDTKNVCLSRKRAFVSKMKLQNHNWSILILCLTMSGLWT